MKDFVGYISDGPFGNLFVNPIYVSLLITMVILLIIVSIYSESRLVKTGFYILCSSLFIVFLHNKLLLIEHRKQLCSKDEQNICSIIDNGTIIGGNNLTSDLSYLNDI